MRWKVVFHNFSRAGTHRRRDTKKSCMRKLFQIKSWVAENFFFRPSSLLVREIDSKNRKNGLWWPSAKAQKKRVLARGLGKVQDLNSKSRHQLLTNSWGSEVVLGSRSQKQRISFLDPNTHFWPEIDPGQESTSWFWAEPQTRFWPRLHRRVNESKMTV